MKRVVKVRGTAIGEGMPKICVPIVGENAYKILEEAYYIEKLNIDVVEWRVDFYEDWKNINSVLKLLSKIREVIKEPIIFTFRSAKEGGKEEISEEYYMELYKAVIISKQVDIIDIELSSSSKTLRELIDEAHENGIFTIVSSHDFNGTPEKDEIVSRLKKSAKLGGDLPKIAVMPSSSKDVITLLDATCIANECINTPIITMSMAAQGVITRLSGEIFGSALTFGSAKGASAPGQIEAKELKDILELLHKELGD